MSGAGDKAESNAAQGHEVFANLCTHYGEPKRRYPTLQHLLECLKHFEQSAGLARHPAEVEIALWFHDAIYELERHDNELASANWAKDELLKAAVDIQVVERVVMLILATRHSASPAAGDEALLVDIDLSILGASTERFREYEQQIRQEYGFVPEPVFVEKRTQILRSFLERPRIYSTAHFFETLEQRARNNLGKAVAAQSPV